MGTTSARLQKSKHKSKVKQFIDLFNKQKCGEFGLKSSKFQQQKKWINKNIQKGVKLRIQSSGNLPKGSCQWIDNIIKYFQKFSQAKHSLQFKDLQDVQFLNSCFELVKFNCILDKKFKISGRIWFTVKTGQIYEIDLKQQSIYKGPSSFDIMWKQQHEKMMQWNKNPQNRAKYAYTQKKTYQSNQDSNNGIYQQQPDWNAHFNAQVQKSNAQFRQNMNKQAAQWNNYVNQQAKRGW